MVLTNQKRDSEKFPTLQLFLLALVRVAEPISLTAIFPYAYQLVLSFHVGNKSNASFYAGILISAFSLAESLTGMYWGGLSDRIGRKPVLLMGCFGTILSLLIVGFSSSFPLALFGRLLGGALNGNIGVIQTMVGEMIVNPAHEPKAYAIMPFVWSVGTILGPSIGGYFATPCKNFPRTFLDNAIFAKFPYALPNVICAMLMLVSMVAGYFCLEETHPDMQPWSTPEDLVDSHAVTPLMVTQASTTTAGANLVHESYGTFNNVREEAIEEEWNVKPDGTMRSPSMSSGASHKVFTKRVVMLTVALGIFTYHSMTFDHLLPIFFQDDRVTLDDQISFSSLELGNRHGSFAGGLGLTIKDVGIIMSVNGLIALFIQAVIFPLAASWLGIWKTFILVSIGHPIALFIVPFLTLVPENLLFKCIYSVLTVRNLFGILAYPVLLILIKEAAPSNSCLGKINGLAASTGAACRTMASPIAGYLYGVGVDSRFTALAWWASAAVAGFGVIQALSINQDQSGPHHQVRGIAPCRLSPVDLEHRRVSSVVHIRIRDERRSPEAEIHSEFASRVPTA